MTTVGAYRFLARAGIALIALAAVAAVGLQIASVRPATPAGVLAARHPGNHRWNHWRQVEVTRADGGDGSPIRVLVVGASVSHGLGASTPNHDYVSDLERMIEQRTGRPVTTVVWSHPGARISLSASWALPGNEQIVITQLITNDFIDGTPLLVYQQSLARLLQRIRATSPHATLLCVGAWEPAFAVNRVGLPVAAYDALDRGACAAGHGSYLSPSAIFQDAACRGPAHRHTAFGAGDDFHPNNLGHQKLADAILHQLERQGALPTAGGSGTTRTGTVLAGAHQGGHHPSK